MSDDSKATIMINFYPAGKLPVPLAKIATEQNFHAERGLVAVRTIVSSPPRFEFDTVGSTPEEIKAYYEKLATEDGADLDEVAHSRLSSA